MYVLLCLHCVFVSLAMPVCLIRLHVGVGCLLGSCVVELIMDKVGLPYRLMSQCDSVICWMNPQVLGLLQYCC